MIFPCGQCKQEVLDTQAGVACDYCDVWYHEECIVISDSYHNQLSNHSNLSWICGCDFPNYTPSLFKTNFGLDLSNSFNPLDATINTADTSDSSHNSLDFNPTHTSAPTKPKPHRRTTVRKLLGMQQIKCNSIKGEDTNLDFHTTIEQHKPDIIFGCESKIDENIPTYSVFPGTYEVYRKDRTANGGGVFGL